MGRLGPRVKPRAAPEVTLHALSSNVGSYGFLTFWLQNSTKASLLGPWGWQNLNLRSKVRLGSIYILFFVPSGVVGSD